MTGPIREIGRNASTPALDDLDTAGLGSKATDAGPGIGAQSPQSHVEQLGERHSALDRLMAGADTLARFRDGEISVPSSPVSQPGDLVRTGDVHADAGAHHATPIARGQEVLVTASTTITDARLSMGAPGAGQPPWVNATVQVREAGQVDRAAINLRIVGAPALQSMPPQSLSTLAQTNGYVLSQGPATTGALTVRGAVLEITGPAGRTILLATTDGGAVMRTGPDVQASVFVRAPDGMQPPMTGPSMGTGLAAIGLGVGTLAGLLSTLGGQEQQMAVWLGRPDGNPAAMPPPEEFRSRWSDLRERLGQDPARIARLEAVLYDALALRFIAAGVDLSARAPALRDAIWAVAVEHGPWEASDGSDIFSSIAAGRDLSRLSDPELVALLYDEQLRTGADGGLVHYPDLGTPALQAATTERLSAERQRLLDRLIREA